MTTAHDLWLTETPEDADEREQARAARRNNRAEPDDGNESRIETWQDASGKTHSRRIYALDFIN